MLEPTRLELVSSSAPTRSFKAGCVQMGLIAALRPRPKAPRCGLEKWVSAALTILRHARGADSS
jgi:hypothetical protein